MSVMLKVSGDPLCLPNPVWYVDHALNDESIAIPLKNWARCCH